MAVADDTAQDYDADYGGRNQGVVILTSVDAKTSQPINITNPLPTNVVGGTAGSPSGGIQTVQGVSGGTPVNTYGLNDAANAAPVSGVGTASVTSATTLFSIDTTGYNGISVQVTSAGTTCTIAYEGSNDNATWVSVGGVGSSFSNLGWSTTSTTANTMAFITSLRYFRTRVSTYTSGTVTVYYALRRSLPIVANQSFVQGAIPSASADSGNPVKIGGIFNSTAPTFTTGQRGDSQINNRGAMLMEQGPYLNGIATADTQIKSGAGFLSSITISGLTATPTAGLLTVYDSLTETGTVLYSEWVFATVTGHTITRNIPFSTGLYVGFDGTLANVQASVTYR